ncbi:MAG: hypothetical protein K6T68_01955 [Alicyclobacillus shizuokensis]|nr:hypothetical protein [Alicyclobacillus shizuokensis]
MEVWHGWQVLQVVDGNDPGAVESALREARAELNRPTLIEVKTVIGYSAPNKQGTHHGGI